jgi:hypothetical protein
MFCQIGSGAKFAGYGVHRPIKFLKNRIGNICLNEIWQQRADKRQLSEGLLQAATIGQYLFIDQGCTTSVAAP